MARSDPKSDLKRGRDVAAAFDRAGLPYRNGSGSHFVGTLPDGSKVVWYAGELSPGVRHKLAKLLAAAGLIGVAFVILLLATASADAADSAIVLPYGDTLTVQCESAHMAPRADNRGALITISCVPSDVYPTPTPAPPLPHATPETAFLPLVLSMEP